MADTVHTKPDGTPIWTQPVETDGTPDTRSVGKSAISTPTAITPSDATDLTTLASIGVTIGVAGNLAFRMAGAPSTTITLAVVAGQYIEGQFTRIMAATTATGIVGWAP